MAQNGSGNSAFRVAGQTGCNIMRNVKHVPYRVGQGPANADAAVPHQSFEHRKPHPPELAAFIVTKSFADNFPRKQAPNAGVRISPQHHIRLARRMGVFGNGPADRNFTVFRQEIQQFGWRIGAPRESNAISEHSIACDGGHFIEIVTGFGHSRPSLPACSGAAFARRHVSVLRVATSPSSKGKQQRLTNLFLCNRTRNRQIVVLR